MPRRWFSKNAAREGKGVRLARYISKCGILSRSRAGELIAAGKVQVNGKPVFDPEIRISPVLDNVEIDRQPIARRPPTYIALNKPTGVITTAHDPEGRPTVYGLLPPDSGWLIPVGRLDKDTSGLLLLTNDTAFADRVTSPTRKVPKTYLVKVQGKITDETVDRLQNGVAIDDDYVTLPAKVSIDRRNKGTAWLSVTIFEGKYRQVRRMCEAVDLHVQQLIRIRIGKLELGPLAKGSWRPLSEEEKAAVFAEKPGT
ncbi:MAG: pseudouridine synthase [Planctomycetota bacterium]|nr:pseudouridine synthase [Planctomycetota bacterium]